MIICFIGAVVAEGVYITLRLLLENTDSFAYGFSGGLCFGTALTLFSNAVRFAVTLKHPDELQKLYVEESDERERFIAEKAAKTSYWVNSFIIALSSAVAAFFSELLAVALLIVLFVMALTKAFFVLYYRKKY